MTCCQCEGIATQFGPKSAERELRRLRRKGPGRTTRLLIDGVRAAGVSDASLLDIGGGVGAVHHALLDAGARDATQVDVSAAYIQAARAEAARRGHENRVHFVHGDFVQVAGDVPEADVVTLDRVICCYPDMDALVGRAAEKTRRVFGAVYPRDVWWMHVFVRVVNLMMRVRRSGFRTYVHSPTAIDAVLRAHGLDPVTIRRTVSWEVATYSRAGA